MTRVRGWDSNPRSRAHEAREDNRSSTAQSGWQESNLRSPAPKAGGVAISPTARSEQRAPPAGFEPAASELRARRHRRFDHGGKQSSGGRARTCLSRLTAARLANSTTPERTAEAAGLEPANGSEAVCAVATRGHASSRRKERESNPQGPRADPFSRRDTAPVAVLPFSGPGRRRTCNPPLKRRQLCQLSYGAVMDVTGRDRTCDAPRFRRALYRAELRSREMGGAGIEPAASSSSERRSTT
jgi:hypothetical protein